MVKEIVEWACDGQVDEDPSVHYYVAGIPMPKAALVEAIKARGLKSVSSVFRELAGGIERANADGNVRDAREGRRLLLRAKERRR